MAEVCEPWHGHSTVALLYYRSYVTVIRSNIGDLQMKRRKWGLRTDFVERENSPLRVAYPFLYKSAMALMRNEHEETPASSTTLCSTWV